ncbi:MAG: hypothetical protein CVU05_05690 [Bacteroidetes bacterium HGW-Bacteroidetes-21]|jgi:uncharacterized membrane protein (DUF485 family)|nr:MAG: hypothetical protein CVU05_05690 [Bacteroidetes bacterium HGW-Bacteroidetes-21]
MLHEPVVEKTTDKAAPKKAKLGVIMFFIYTIVYAGFVVIGLTNPKIMGLEVLAEQNLAIVYGFGLIVLAIVMGFIYNFLCTRLEDKMNKN